MSPSNPRSLSWRILGCAGLSRTASRSTMLSSTFETPSQLGGGGRSRNRALNAPPISPSDPGYSHARMPRESSLHCRGWGAWELGAPADCALAGPAPPTHPTNTSSAISDFGCTEDLILARIDDPPKP